MRHGVRPANRPVSCIKYYNIKMSNFNPISVHIFIKTLEKNIFLI